MARTPKPDRLPRDLRRKAKQGRHASAPPSRRPRRGCAAGAPHPIEHEAGHEGQTSCRRGCLFTTCRLTRFRARRSVPASAMRRHRRSSGSAVPTRFGVIEVFTAARRESSRVVPSSHDVGLSPRRGSRPRDFERKWRRRRRDIGPGRSELEVGRVPPRSLWRWCAISRPYNIILYLIDTSQQQRRLIA